MSQLRPAYAFLCLILIVSGILAAPPKTTTTSDQNDRPTVIKYKAIFSSDVLASASRGINTFMSDLFRYVHIVPRGSELQEQSSSSMQNDSKFPFDIVFELNHVSIPITSNDRKNRRSPKSEEKATSNWIDYLMSTTETLANLVDKFLGRLNGDNVRVVRLGTDIVANNNTTTNNNTTEN